MWGKLGSASRIGTQMANGAVPFFVRYSQGGGVPPFLLSALLALKHDARALPQRDPGRRPARHRCPVGRLRHLEVGHAGDVFDYAHAGLVPNVDAKSKMRLGFHGQARLDWPWPGTIYTPCSSAWCAPAQTARTLPLSSVTPCR